MKIRRIFSLILLIPLAVFSSVSLAEDVHSPQIVAKLDKYKALMTEWAANPVVVDMVKASNASGGMISGMTNSKWNFLEENDPQVLKFKHNKAAEMILKWETASRDEISKLYLRDQHGNLVASSNVKPLVYNNRTKPPFENAMKGKPWSAGEIKPDPGTQVPGIHVSVPVFDGTQVIGILHSSVVVR